jgi:hypothetical protein
VKAFNLDEEQRSQLVKRVVASFGASCRSAKTHATAPVTRRTGSRAFGLRTFALQKGRELPLPEVLCSRSDAGRTYSARRYSGMLDGIVVRLRKPIARLSRSSPSALRQSSVSFCVIFRSVCCDGMAPNPTSQTGPKSGVHFSQHSCSASLQGGAQCQWLPQTLLLEPLRCLVHPVMGGTARDRQHHDA